MERWGFSHEDIVKDLLLREGPRILNREYRLPSMMLSQSNALQ